MSFLTEVTSNWILLHILCWHHICKNVKCHLDLLPCTGLLCPAGEKGDCADKFGGKIQWTMDIFVQWSPIIQVIWRKNLHTRYLCNICTVQWGVQDSPWSIHRLPILTTGGHHTGDFLQCNTEFEFLDAIRTKVSSVFHPAVHSHLY